MKICSECKFSETKAMQDDRGNIGSVMLCMNSECRDVIVGNPIPCINARQANVYCSFEAKYFLPKPANTEPAKVVSLIQKS